MWNILGEEYFRSGLRQVWNILDVEYISFGIYIGCGIY